MLLMMSKLQLRGRPSMASRDRLPQSNEMTRIPRRLRFYEEWMVSWYQLEFTMVVSRTPMASFIGRSRTEGRSPWGRLAVR